MQPVPARTEPDGGIESGRQMGRGAESLGTDTDQLSFRNQKRVKRRPNPRTVLAWIASADRRRLRLGETRVDGDRQRQQSLPFLIEKPHSRKRDVAQVNRRRISHKRTPVTTPRQPATAL